MSNVKPLRSSDLTVEMLLDNAKEDQADQAVIVTFKNGKLQSLWSTKDETILAPAALIIQEYALSCAKGNVEYE